MKTLSSAQKNAKNALHGTGPYLWLFDFQRDSTNTSRYCLGEEDVTFNSLSYTAKEINIEDQVEDLAGTLHDVGIEIGDSAGTGVAYWANGKYKNQRFTLRLVNNAHLGTPTDEIVWRGIIKSGFPTEGKFTFAVGGYDLRRAYIPRDRMRALSCRWRFKSNECTYAGGETVCDHSPDTCENTMSNLASIGCAPGLPRFRP